MVNRILIYVNFVMFEEEEEVMSDGDGCCEDYQLTM